MGSKASKILMRNSSLICCLKLDLGVRIKRCSLFQIRLLMCHNRTLDHNRSSLWQLSSAGEIPRRISNRMVKNRYLFRTMDTRDSRKLSYSQVEICCSGSGTRMSECANHGEYI